MVISSPGLISVLALKYNCPLLKTNAEFGRQEWFIVLTKGSRHQPTWIVVALPRFLSSSRLIIGRWILITLVKIYFAFNTYKKTQGATHFTYKLLEISFIKSTRYNVKYIKKFRESFDLVKTRIILKFI